MQLQDLIGHIATRQGWAWRPDPGGDVLLEVPLVGGRTQVVRVSQVLDPEQIEVVTVWSISGAASAVTDPWALMRYSASIVYGSIVVSGDQIAVKHSIRAGAADDVTMTKAIFHVGRVADALEAEAYGHHDQN